MATLTYDELRRLATNAAARAAYAWRFNEGPGMMAAIALAESGGNPSAHNAKPPDDSYGLWQINMIGKLGPVRRKQFKIKSNNELLNPNTNADAMIKVLGEQGLKAWSTYTNGSYKKFSHGKVDLDAGPIGDKVTDTVDAVPGAIGKATNAIADGLFKIGVNFGAGLLAVVLLVLGVVVLSRTSAAKVAKVAAKVIT